MTEPAPVETEDRILEAAHRVFLRRGVAAARTQEIADEAGVNKALLHYYFRSEGKLADAVFLRAAGTLFPQLLGALASDLPLRDKLQAVVDAEMSTIEANPFLPGYILCELRADSGRLTSLIEDTMPPGEMRAALFGSLQTQIDLEVEAGRMRPVSARQVMVTLMSLLIFPHAASHMLEIAAGLDAEAQADLAEWRRASLVDFVLRGFSA